MRKRRIPASKYEVERARLLNRVFDFKIKNKFTRERIAREIGSQPGWIDKYLLELSKSVGPETAKKLLMTKKELEAFETAQRLEGTAKKRRKKTKRELKRAEIRKWLEEHPLKMPSIIVKKGDIKTTKAEIDRVEKRIWAEFANKTPKEIMAEIERIDAQIERTRDINRLNILATERRTLCKRLLNI